MSKYSEKKMKQLTAVNTEIIPPVRPPKHHSIMSTVELDAKISFYTKYLQEFAFELKKLQRIKVEREIEIHKSDEIRKWLSSDINKSKC